MRVERMKQKSSKMIVFVILVILALICLFPFFWMIITSFKTQQEINLMPPTIIPNDWQIIENYFAAWTKPESTFGRYFINTIIIAGFGTIVQLAICIPIAFAISHFRFKGRNILFLLILSTMMIPYDVTLIPNFITIRSFPLAGGNDIFGNGGQGFYDSYSGMVLPFLADAFSIFLIRQAFLTISRDYWDAAQIDGMGHFGYLCRVLVPLAWPSVVTAALLGFIGKWNGVLWPLLITSSEHLRPLQVGLLNFVSEEGHYYHLLMAAATFTVLPIIILYFITQRWFNDGIGSGLKG
ncbi:carbohydrate ABC transporter permease [Bacillus suaedae]|uniref:Carbohydrate ABC transporter permease n=1 Tax=Halalkalibacter suaedae TaxID=2822140 RepID=A0A940WPD6_9BACI|nr:carbohydrate ABC transporter permease [Bacillus suaedae]MBP3950194.1 carbohydrate ABC transporter permease [Bacillus suaedae]